MFSVGDRGDGPREFAVNPAMLRLSPIHARRSPDRLFDPKDYESVLLLIPSLETMEMWFHQVKHMNGGMGSDYVTAEQTIVDEIKQQLQHAISPEPLIIELWKRLSEMAAEATVGQWGWAPYDQTHKRSLVLSGATSERRRAAYVYDIIERVMYGHSNYFTLTEFPIHGFTTWRRQHAELVRFFESGRVY